MYEELLGRAAAAGRPLNPVPALVMADTPRQSSYSFVKSGRSGEPPPVRLDQALLDPAVPDRAWTIAHELSHHVRHQDGSRVIPSNGYEAATAAVGLLAAAVFAVSGFTPYFLLVFVLGAALVVLMARDGGRPDPPGGGSGGRDRGHAVPGGPPGGGRQPAAPPRACG